MFSGSTNSIPTSNLLFYPVNSAKTGNLETNHDFVKIQIKFSGNFRASTSTTLKVTYTFFNEDYIINFQVGEINKNIFYTFVRKDDQYYNGLSGNSIGQCFIYSNTSVTELFLKLDYFVDYIDIN